MNQGIESYIRFLEGNQAEMRNIVEMYWDSMLLFTNGYVHNISDAEDIAQEALIKLAVKRPKFQEEYQLKAYLFKICRNLAINSLKKNQRSVLIEPETAEELEDETALIEERMSLEHSRQQLHHAMMQLKQEYREVLYLRYFENLSMKETARIMHCTEKQATATAYQARQQLKKILEKEGFTGENL